MIAYFKNDALRKKIVRQIYLKKIVKKLNILAETEKEKLILYALTEMNIFYEK